MESRVNDKQKHLEYDILSKSFQKVFSGNDRQSIEFLKNLIWIAIAIKEERFEWIASESRWDIEQYHYSILKLLCRLLAGKPNSDRFPKFTKSSYNMKYDADRFEIFLTSLNWDYFINEMKFHHSDKVYAEILRLVIFDELHINEQKLISDSRDFYSDISSDKHANEKRKILDIASDTDFLQLFQVSIRFFLLYISILSAQDENEKIRDQILDVNKKFSIAGQFPYLFSLTSQEIINNFIQIIFSDQRIRNFLFEYKILTNKDVINRTFLQNYFPYLYLEDYQIQKLFNAKEVQPFRVDGPHFIDFQEGNWIFISKIVKRILKILEQDESILISGTTGAGKSIISRYLGFKHKNNYPQSHVYYFDFLDINEKKSEDIMDYFSRINQKSEFFGYNSLFIFENIHILNYELKKKLEEIKNSVLSILVERTFEGSKIVANVGSNRNYEISFVKPNIFKIDSSTIEEIRKGIINNNIHDPIDIEQFFCLPFEDLWMYSFLIRIYKSQIHQKKSVNLRELILHKKLVMDELISYFNQIFIQKSADFKYKSSQMSKILNHLRLILIPISIFSEYEFWISKGFLDIFFSLDSGPVANFRDNIQFDSAIISDVLDFLVKANQLKYRQRKRKDGFLVDEYRIPHSRLSKIYKNLLVPQDYEIECQLLALSLSFFRDSSIYIVFLRILYPFYREKNDNVEEKREKFIPKIKQYIEGFSPRISDSFVKIENINNHIKYLNTISYYLPEIWDIVLNNILFILENDDLRQKQLFRQIDPGIFPYLLKYFMQSKSSMRVRKILDKNQKIINKKLKELSIFDFIRILSQIDNIFEKKPKTVIIESIENKIFELIAKMENNQKLIIFYPDKVENGERFFREIFTDNQKLVENGIQTQILKLYQTLFIENYLYLENNVSIRIFQNFSFNFSFLRQDLVNLSLKNINDENFITKTNDILHSFDFYELKGFIKKFYDISYQIISQVESEDDRLKYIGNLKDYLENALEILYNQAIRGENKGSAQYNWVDMIIDFFNTYSDLIQKNNFHSITSNLRNHQILNEFEWILSRFEHNSLDFILKYSSQLFLYTDFEILFGVDKFKELKSQFEDILKKNLFNLDQFSEKIEILINHFDIIKNFHIKSLDFFDNYKEKLLNLIYTKFFQEESHSESILNILDYNHVNHYLDEELINYYIQNHNNVEIFNLLELLRGKWSFYHDFVERFKRILEEKLGEDFAKSSSIRQNIAYFQNNCDIENIQSIIEFIEKESDNLIFNIGNHINPITLDDNQIRIIYNWLIQKPSSEIFSVLHKFNYIFLELCPKLHQMNDNQLYNLLLKEIISNMKFHFAEYLIEDDLFLRMEKPILSLENTYEWTRNILFKYIKEHCDHFVSLSLKNLKREQILLVLLSIPYIIPNDLIDVKLRIRKIHSFDLDCKKDIKTRANQEIESPIISNNEELKKFFKFMGEWPSDIQNKYTRFFKEYLKNADNFSVENPNDANVVEYFLYFLYELQDALFSNQFDQSEYKFNQTLYSTFGLNFTYFCQNLDLETDFRKKFQQLNYIAYFISDLSKNQSSNYDIRLEELYDFSMSEKFIFSLEKINTAYILEYYHWFTDYFSYSDEQHPVLIILKERFRNMQCIELIQLLSSNNINEGHIEILLNYFDEEIKESVSRYLKTTILHYKQFANLSIPENQNLNYVESYFYIHIKDKLDDNYYFE